MSRKIAAGAVALAAPGLGACEDDGEVVETCTILLYHVVAGMVP